MSNFRYRLREAVKILATGKDDVKVRIYCAVTEHLALSALGIDAGDDVPIYFRDKVNGILDKLTEKTWDDVTKIKTGIKGDRLRATLHGKHRITVSKFAAEIWTLYHEYEDYLRSGKLPNCGDTVSISSS